MTEELVLRGANVAFEPIPGEAFDDELISFMYVSGGFDIELVHTDRRRSLIK